MKQVSSRRSSCVLRNWFAIALSALLAQSAWANLVIDFYPGVGDKAALRGAFISALQVDSSGGLWAVNAQDQLMFADLGGAQNAFTQNLNNLNNAANGKTVYLGLDIPGVLVGAYGPGYPGYGAGQQLIDMTDVSKFTALAIAQPQPLLDTRGSVLLHELAELVSDGGLLNFNASHGYGIDWENAVLGFDGILGQRLHGGDVFRQYRPDPSMPPNKFRVRVPFVATANIAAGGGLPAITAGTQYHEAVYGTVSGPNNPLPDFAPSNVARGLVDSGYSYDETGYSVDIDRIVVEIPEPSTLGLVAISLVGIFWTRRRNRWYPNARPGGELQ